MNFSRGLLPNLCLSKPLQTPAFALIVLFSIGLVAGYFFGLDTGSGIQAVEQQLDQASASRQIEATEIPPLRYFDDSDSQALAILSSLSLMGGSPGHANRGIVVHSRDLLDASRPLPLRQRAAWSLGRLGSDEAVAILKQGLQTGTPLLRVTIAEALGNSDNKNAQLGLRELLKDSDPAVARGAIRGLGAVADADSIELLAQFTRDATGPQEMRIEAALALGQPNLPAATDALVKALDEAQEEEFASAIVTALGEQSFTETEAVFRGLLSNPNTMGEVRIAAVEALGQAQGDPTMLLMEQFDDPDPAIRAAAAWAVANRDSLRNLAPKLRALQEKEADAEVRARILQALKHHGE